MAKTHLAVDPMVDSIWPTVGDSVGRALEQRWIGRATIKIADAGKAAHDRSEPKQSCKVESAFFTVAQNISLRFNPSVAVKP